MKITVKTGAARELSADLLAIPLAEAERPAGGRAKAKAAAKARPAKKPTAPRLSRGLEALDRDLGGLIASALASGDFTGRLGQRLVLYPAPGARVRRIALIGMGKKAELDGERLRRIGAACVPGGGPGKVERMAIVAAPVKGMDSSECAARLAEGAVLSAYHFDAYLGGDERKRKPPRALSIVFERLGALARVRRAVADAVIAADSQNIARDLSNQPPNELPPSALASRARSVARKVGLRCRVMRVAELEHRGMSALLAVGQGSAHPPHLIVLEHEVPARRRARTGTLCLVGKGITFDSGGLSLKPAASMDEMKHDMSGAATVVGAMRAIALLDLPVHVVGIIAAAENMPSGDAYRPGDIIDSLAGKTIEVTNTDAEGRVVLADALHFARSEYSPAAIVDVATLTGAAMVAFGPWATAGLGNDDELLDAIRQAGEAVGERVWPMPLLPEHHRVMRSTVADLRNSGGREAGVSTAGAFLAAFAGDTPWVHLDIAGTGWTSTRTPYHRGGATGVGVRLLLEWVRNRMVQPA